MAPSHADTRSTESSPRQSTPRAATPRTSMADRIGPRTDRSATRDRKRADARSSSRPRPDAPETSADQPEKPITLDRLESRRADVALDLFDRTAAHAQQARIDRRYAINIIGAHRQGHLRELRAVKRPVHLDRFDVG